MAEAQAKAKGTDLKVVGVETLDDALAALQAYGGSGLPTQRPATAWPGELPSAALPPGLPTPAAWSTYARP